MRMTILILHTCIGTNPQEMKAELALCFFMTVGHNAHVVVFPNFWISPGLYWIFTELAVHLDEQTVVAEQRPDSLSIEVDMLFFLGRRVYYDTTTGVGAHYSDPTSLLSAQIEVLGKQIAYTSQNLQHQPGPGHPHTVYYSESDESDEDDLGSREVIRDIFLLLGDRKREIPLISDPVFKTFDLTMITNPLFDFDYEFTLNSDNPILVIQNEESDESKTETIMEEVQGIETKKKRSVGMGDLGFYPGGREFEPGYGKVLQFPPLPRQQPRRLHVDATWTHLGGDTWQPDPLTVDPLTR
ncbi:hypothetical protein Tco_0410174 [Tanacetum coccineum]